MPRTRSESICCACLCTKTSTTTKLSKVDENKISLLDKLKTALPEIVWLAKYRICETCTQELNVVHRFRETCLKSDLIRKEKTHNVNNKKDKKEKLILNDCKVEEIKTEEALLEPKEPISESIEKVDEVVAPQKNGTLELLKEESEASECDIVADDNNADSDNDQEDKEFELIEVIQDYEEIVKTEDPVDKQNNLKKRKRRVIRFECEKCQQKFSSSIKLIDHCVEDHNIPVKEVRPFTCERCPRRFANSSNLLQHIKYHDAVRSNVCTYCGKGFITKTDLNIHEKHHLNKREYKCEECMKCFNTHKDLRSHKLVVHTDSREWKYKCDFCDKRFPIKSNYDCHMRRHTGDKKFHCHLCDKKFSDKCVLQRHMRTHSNVRDFKCSACHKEYKDKRVMQVHMAKVHGIGVGDIKLPTKERKYICHICPKAYYAKNKLMRHLYTHSGEKPFSCGICDRKFNDRSYVKQHMRKTHNIMLEHIDDVGIPGEG